MPSDGARSGGNRPPRHDWRGGGQKPRPVAAAGAAGAAGGKGPDWVRRKGYDSEKLLWKFRAKIAFGVLVAAALFGVLVWMLRPPKTTPFISVVFSEYKYPIPPNAWAFDDVENITDLLSRDGPNRTGGEPLSITDERRITWTPDKEVWIDNLRRQVEAAATIKWYQGLGRGPDDGVVIVYLSGHGVVDDDGRACLLLPQQFDTDPLFDPARRIPIRELLDRLFYDRSGERERLPRDVLKLVVLDANRIDQNWELGLPYNAFTENLRETVEKDLPVSNLFVLNSTDAGQIGWTSPELGGTVFGHFVRRGLQGHADGYAAEATVRDRDRFVTVAELQEYVRRQTAQFVANFRGDEQRPLLIASASTSTSARDRKLVEYGDNLLSVDAPDGDDAAEARAARLKQIGAKWAELRREGWNHYAELSAVGARRHPLAWQRFQGLLLRLEQLAAAGGAKPHADQYTEGLAELKRLRQAIAEPAAPNEYPNGIALATAIGGNRFAGSKAVDDAAATFRSGKDELEGPTAGDYFFRTQAVWRWATRLPADADLAKQLDRAATRLLPTSGSWQIENEPVETHFLRMLAAYRNKAESFNPSAVAAAIERRDLAERVAAPADERTHYWLRTTAAAGDEARRIAEDRLFVGRKSDVEIAVQRGLAANQAYDRAEKLSTALAAAYQLRDQALADIPWLLRYRARRLETTAPRKIEDDAIIALLDLHHDVKQQIGDFTKKQVGGEFNPPDVEQFAAQTKQLRQRTDALRDEAVKKLGNISAKSSNADRRRMLDALSLPLLADVDRGREVLHDQAVRLFGRDFTYDELAPNENASAEASGTAIDHHLDRILKWKTQPALALADLPPPDVKAMDRAALVAAAKSLRQRIAELSAQVAAAQQTPGDLSLDEGIAPPPARTTLARIDLDARASGLFRGPLPKLSPAERLQRYDRQRLLVWHFQRTLADFWGPAPDKIDKSFFQVAARRAWTIARRQDDVTAAKSADAARQEQEDSLRARLASRENAAKDGLTPNFAEDDLRIKIDPAATTPQKAEQRVTIRRPANADLPPGVAAYYLAEARDAQASTATVRGDLVAVSGDQVATADSRLDYTISADMLRGGDERQLPKYALLDAAAQYRDVPFLRGLVLYRGHRFRHPLQKVELIPYGCDRDLEYRPPAYDPPVVTVALPETSRAVVLVLDCSASMSKDVAGRTRIDVVREVIRGVVDELSFSGTDVQVGLFLYGHRTIYQYDKDPKRGVPANFVPESKHPLINSLYTDSFGGKNTPPPDDVEEAIPLSKLNDGVKKDIFARLNAVRPNGYTPLYLSIQRALDIGFSRVKGKNVQRQLIVVTDGANTQSAKDPDAPAGSVITAAALRATLEANARLPKPSQVRVDVVGFEFDDGVPSKEGGEWILGDKSELSGMLKEPTGLFTEISSKKDVEGESPIDRLIESLRQQLGIFRYRIVDAGTSSAILVTADGKQTRGPLMLNRPVTIGALSGKYIVRFESSLKRDSTPPVNDYPFELLNRGERLVLRVQENRVKDGYQRWLTQEDNVPDRLEYRVGDRESLGKDLLDTKGRPIHIFPRPPVWDGNAAGFKFRVAIRYPDGKQFTPQPVEAFAVVQPFSNRATDFTVFDVTFEPGQPGPELSFVVPNWKEKAGNANRAIIKLWFKFDSQTVPVKKVRADTLAMDPIEVDGKPVKYAITNDFIESQRKYVVKVTESHVKDDNSPGQPKSMDKIKVSMDEPPTRVHRCYVTGGKEIVHTFEYLERPGLTRDQVKQFQVLFTRVEDMKRDSVHVHERDDRAILVDTVAGGR